LELLLGKNGLIGKAGEIGPISETPRIVTKYTGPDKILFLVRSSGYYENSGGYLFQWDQHRLTLLRKAIEDVAIDPAGNRMAVCYLTSGNRRLNIVDLD
jgi:hypothetical protein